MLLFISILFIFIENIRVGRTIGRLIWLNVTRLNETGIDERQIWLDYDGLVRMKYWLNNLDIAA